MSEISTQAVAEYVNKLIANSASLEDVRASLGLGTMATQNASAVAITGGNLSGVTVVANSLNVNGPSTFAFTDVRTPGVGAFFTPWYFNHQVSAGANGHRNSAVFELRSGVSAPGTNLVPLQSISHITGTGSGYAYGFNSYAWVDSTAAATSWAIGGEIDTDVRRAVATKVGLQIVDVATSTGSGSTRDAALFLAAQSGGAGFARGVHFSTGGGAAPVRSTGTLLVADAMTVVSAIDFSALTCSYLMKGPNSFAVDGGGAIRSGAAFAASANYSGSATTSRAVFVSGSNVSPVSSNQDAVLIVQKTSSSAATTGVNAAAYFSMSKRASANSTFATSLFSEAIDPVGGSNTWLEGGRFHAFGTGGTNGGFYGIVSAAGVASGISYTYMVGIEATNENHSGFDAPQFWSFSKAKFAAAFVATNITNGTGSKGDAAFLTNPYSGAPWKTGFLVYGYDGAQRGVEDTGFGILKTLNVGIDLSQGVYNTAAILLPNNAPMWYRNAANSGNLNVFNVDASNNLVLGTNAALVVVGASVYLPSSALLTWNNDTFLSRRADGNVQLGAADAASPVGQTLSAQNVVAGTTNASPGVNLRIRAPAGTGTGVGGSIVFQTAPAGSSGSAQNSFADVLTLDPGLGASFAGLIAMPNNTAIYFKNAANTNYIPSILLDGLNQLNVGINATKLVVAPPASFGSTVALNVASLQNAANDSAAATAGVADGDVYRNGSVLMVRVS